MKSLTYRILAVVLVMLLAFTVTQPITVSAIEGRTAELYDYSNVVTVTRGKTDINVFKGMRLKEGDKIKTGKDSTAYIEIDSDKVIKLAPSTIVAISNMSGTDKNGCINISLSSGKIFNDIKEKLTKNSTYNVETPNAVMGVRGTKFVVDLETSEGNSSKTVLTVFDGTVAMALNGQPDSNIYVEMNQTADTSVLVAEKPVVTQLNPNDLSTFELTEIIKYNGLKENINKLLNKENKTVDEVVKQAEKEQKELEKDQKDNEKQAEKQQKESEKDQKDDEKQAEKQQKESEKDQKDNEKQAEKQQKESEKDQKDNEKQQNGNQKTEDKEKNGNSGDTGARSNASDEKNSKSK